MHFLRTIKRKFASRLNTLRLRRKAEKKGLKVVPENILYCPSLPLGTVLDCGCSYQAELARFMVNHYGATALCVDPTSKHSVSLVKLSGDDPRIKYLPYAVAARDCILDFYESQENESGSIMPEHTNATLPSSRSYSVKACTLSTLLEIASLDAADYIKLDLEGAEYDLLLNCESEILLAFGQVFVEFHHHCIPQYALHDTELVVSRLESVGFKSITLDGHNYLFIRKDLIDGTI